jgi:hypothetical protein
VSNHDLSKYKKAKSVVRDLTTLLQIINLSINGLTPFRKYTSISETLACLEDNKTILSVHLDHHSQIIANKGSIPHET